MSGIDPSEARVLALLGETPQGPVDDAGAGDWAQGFGIVSPDVARYVEVLREVPDAMLLAMRNVAAAEDVELVDADTATLLALHARALRPAHVLEVGTGVGYLTLHLARAVPSSCTITSIEPDPLRQAQAHAFLERDRYASVTELRLGDPLRLLHEASLRTPFELVVLTDPALPRLDVVAQVVDQMPPDSVLAVPFALRGGRVANTGEPGAGRPEIAAQRAFNRQIAADPRFCDVTLLPVGDGLLLARRRG